APCLFHCHAFSFGCKREILEVGRLRGAPNRTINGFLRTMVHLGQNIHPKCTIVFAAALHCAIGGIISPRSNNDRAESVGCSFGGNLRDGGPAMRPRPGGSTPERATRSRCSTRLRPASLHASLHGDRVLSRRRRPASPPVTRFVASVASPADRPPPPTARPRRPPAPASARHPPPRVGLPVSASSRLPRCRPPRVGIPAPAPMP